LTILFDAYSKIGWTCPCLKKNPHTNNQGSYHSEFSKITQLMKLRGKLRLTKGETSKQLRTTRYEQQTSQK
jgi:hypothetical protein